MRIKLIRVIFSCALLVIVGNLFYVQVIQGPFFYQQSVNNRIRAVPQPGMRGRIKDCNGLVLAENRLSFNVAIIPQDVRNRDRLFAYLSRALGMSKEKLAKQYLQKKIAPFAPVVIVEDIDRRLAMTLEENKFLYPGLYIQESYRRTYPFGSIGAHVLGYVSKISESRAEKLKEYGYTVQSDVGYAGVEEFYDHFLKGQDGGLQIEVNSRGQQVRLLGVRQGESGRDVALTIDWRVQQAAYEILGDRRGAIVLSDLDTGEILGMVSSPSYDPNIFTDSQLRGRVATLFRDESSPLLNRAMGAAYPPGSVFKNIVAIAGLMSGKINVHTSFTCPGYYSLGKRKFACAHVHGTQDLLEAISHSCNVYFFNVGDLLGPDPLEKTARLLGLGSLTNVDLPAEEKGFIPGRASRKGRKDPGWYKGDTLNTSIGQGEVLSTPLQLVRMTATIARSGKEFQPHLIQDIGGQPMVKLSTVKIIPFPEKIYETVQAGLRMTVTDGLGTGRILNMDGFEVSGKTGTAQTVPGKENHAWFVGFNNLGKRRVVFCVFLEYGGSSYNAVVLTKELLLRLREEDIL